MYKVEVERRVIEVVEIFIDTSNPADAMDQAVELAQADDGEIIHREVYAGTEIASAIEVESE